MSIQPTSPGPDFLSLASAAMPALVAAVEEVVEDGDDVLGVPPAPVQLADLIRAEAIRLIRLGAPAETSSAAKALTRLMSGWRHAALAERDPEAARVIDATGSVLSAAIAPSSRGGEMAVLRSWSGRARELVTMLNDAPGHSLPRAKLRERLGVEEQSHLSHILGDLEAAGLVVRIRSGRNVVVHLGPSARTSHIQELLRREDACLDAIWEALERLVAEPGAAVPPGVEDVAAEIGRFRARVQRPRFELERLSADQDMIMWAIRFVGTRWGVGAGAMTVDLCQVWRARVADGQVVTVGCWSDDIETQLGRHPMFDHTSFGLEWVMAPWRGSSESRQARMGRFADSLSPEVGAFSDEQAVVHIWTLDEQEVASNGASPYALTS